MNKFFIILLLTFTISAMEQTEKITPENCSGQYKQEYERVYNEALAIKSGKGYNGRKPSKAFGNSPGGQLYAYENNLLYISAVGLAKYLLKAREDAITDIHLHQPNRFEKTAQ